MPGPAPGPPALERLGPFVLLEPLGAGAMGTVWRARDEEEERDVALKVFPPDLSRREGFLARFRRETEAGRRIDDPHVVRTYGAEMQLVDGEPCCVLVLECVEGQTLGELLADLHQLPEGLAREIARQVAMGLVAIHAAGVVHRDLKPDNILITPANVVRIADLGVAKVIDATVALTREGHFAGSLAYASPEQIHGRDVGPASDLYSLGVLVHELLTGTNPFARATAAEVMQAHLIGEVPDVQDAAPDTSAFLAEVVRSLLGRSPAERFDSAASLAAVLGEGEASSWWRAREVDAARRRAQVPRVPVRRETALHGRENDVALLRSSWERARTGGGNTLLVVGEAGIGKSRLVDAFFGTLAGADCHVLYGSFPPVGGRGAISDAIVARLGADDLDDRVARLLGDAPLLARSLASWLRHEPTPPGAPALDDDALRAGLVRLMHGLAAASPLVWVVEDLHFADEDSRKLALALARAVAEHRALLVFTSRPGLPESEVSEFARLENLRRTDLGRLSAREVVLLLQDAFRSERLAEKLGAKVALASDGNPFFVFEMIRGLKQGQFVTELPNGTWIDTKVIAQIPVPPAVRDLVAARLADLPQSQREIADAGAVQGYEFDADLVADVLGRNRFEVLRDLAQIERGSGVVRSSGRRHRFDHHQIQEFLYSDLSQPLREEFHAATAEAIERASGAAERAPERLEGGLAVRLAEHFLQGGRGRQGLRYAIHALRHLEAACSHDAMLRLAGCALGIPDLLSDVERCEVLLLRSRTFDTVGRRLEERADLDTAVALAESSGDRASCIRAWNHLGGHLCYSTEKESALGLLARARTLARDSGDVRGEATANRYTATILRGQGRYDEADEHSRRAILLARRINDLRSEAASVLQLSGTARMRGHRDEALAHAQEAAEKLQECGDLQGEGVARSELADSLWSVGREAEARAQLARAAEIARAVGSAGLSAHVADLLGGHELSAGNFAAAVGHLERALPLLRGIENRNHEAGCLANTGTCWLELGRTDRARDSFETCVALSRTACAPTPEGFALHGLALAELDAGAHDRALDWIADAVARRRSSGETRWLVDSLLVQGDILRRTGYPRAARTAAEEARSTSLAHGWRDQALVAEALLAALPGGDARAAVDALRACPPDNRRMEADLLLWTATHDLTHLVHAMRSLDVALAKVPAEYHETMLRNVTLNRDIAAAAAAAGLCDSHRADLRSALRSGSAAGEAPAS